MTPTAARWGFTVAVVLSLALLTACSSPADHPRPVPTSATTPSIAAMINVPFHVNSTVGTTADVTLRRVDYKPIPGTGGNPEFAILDITIVGRSTLPFQYNLNNFGFQYASGTDPYHPADTLITGVDPSDIAAARPAVVMGAVNAGATLTELVPLRVTPHSRLLVSMSEGTGTRLVEWLVPVP